MNNVYDNWERLVRALWKREEDWELAHAPSSESSLSSVSTDFTTRLAEAFSSSVRPFDDGDHSRVPGSEDGILQLHIAIPIPFNELKNATTNFGPGSIIGIGEFGVVYKGWIDAHTLTAEKPGSGLAVAIKRSNDMPWFKEWLKEVRQLHHPNLIKLIAYCHEASENLLVHEFMPNRSLDYHLFKRRAQCLSWEARIKVAIGVARGLSFLHRSPNNKTHGNLRSSNILLDEEFNAKLSCFCYLEDTSGSYGIPAGTFYGESWEMDNAAPAPTWKYKGLYAKECDIYAFGFVLLELLSGRQAIDRGGEPLVYRMRPYLSSEEGIHQIMDTKLEGRYHHEAASAVAAVALQCVSNVLPKRRNMADVLAELEQLQYRSGTQSSSNSNLYVNGDKESSSTLQKVHSEPSALLWKLFME